MPNLREISIIGIFTALIIATNFLLFQFPNVKLEDTLVFSSSYAFGLKIGLCIALFSELIWGIVSPYGFGSFNIPFLVAGETIYAFGGQIASRVWGKQIINPGATANLFFGAILAICAFCFDIETNVFTSVIATGHLTFIGTITTIGFGAWFMVSHEISDFVLGAYLAPVVIAYFLRKYPLGRISSDSRELKLKKSE